MSSPGRERNPAVPTSGVGWEYVRWRGADADGRFDFGNLTHARHLQSIREGADLSSRGEQAQAPPVSFQSPAVAGVDPQSGRRAVEAPVEFGLHRLAGCHVTAGSGTQ
jgi:hypothetical protein